LAPWSPTGVLPRPDPQPAPGGTPLSAHRPGQRRRLGREDRGRQPLGPARRQAQRRPPGPAIGRPLRPAPLHPTRPHRPGPAPGRRPATGLRPRHLLRRPPGPAAPPRPSRAVLGPLERLPRPLRTARGHPAVANGQLPVPRAAPAPRSELLVAA